MLCFLCKKNQFEEIYSLKTKKILRCKNDGLFVGQTVASSRNNAYKKGYFSNPPHPPKSNQTYFLNKLVTIKQVTRNKFPYILDVGCGWGDFEEVLEKEKIPYLGIDTSKEAIKICQKKGLNCQRITVEQLIMADGEIGRDPASATSDVAGKFDLPRKSEHLWEGKSRQNLNNSPFDAITMFQLIEHLKNPLPLLQSAKKLLKKNGVILITTPNNDSPLRKLFGAHWSVYNEPSHFVFYNNKTLKETLEIAGFKNIQTKLDRMRFLSFNYILNRLKQMYFPTFNFSLLTFNFPLPTDPFGDLEAVGFKDYL